MMIDKKYEIMVKSLKKIIAMLYKKKSFVGVECHREIHVENLCSFLKIFFSR